VDDRQQRIGRNEALFRTVNEKIDDLNATFQVTTPEFAAICECGDESCVEQFTIDTAAYQRIRTDPTLFVLVPGHESPTTEDVVEDDQQSYVVVRKHPGEPADIATETAPES
jgi:hypothetical protein